MKDKHTIYLKKSIKFGFPFASSLPVEKDDGWVMLADPVLVKFILYSHETANLAEIEVLENTVEAMRAEAAKNLNVVLGRIQELKALPGSK